MKTLSNYKSKTLLGYNNNEAIYLTAPSWDCDWYWGFGYLGNRNCHYHMDGLNKKKDFHSALIEHFGHSLNIQPSKTWTFAELMKSVYLLKSTAELLGRGSANLTSNPCKDVIINTEETKRINNVVLPQIFEEIYDILQGYDGYKKNMNKLIHMNSLGDTTKIVLFMNDKGITTDDLKETKEISSRDFTIIHSKYWEMYHANKK